MYLPPTPATTSPNISNPQFSSNNEVVSKDKRFHQLTGNIKSLLDVNEKNDQVC